MMHAGTKNYYSGWNDASASIFAGSPALDRSFLDKHHVDLYVRETDSSLTFINGILDLIRKRKA